MRQDFRVSQQSIRLLPYTRSPTGDPEGFETPPRVGFALVDAVVGYRGLLFDIVEIEILSVFVGGVRGPFGFSLELLQGALGHPMGVPLRYAQETSRDCIPRHSPFGWGNGGGQLSLPLEWEFERSSELVFSFC